MSMHTPACKKLEERHYPFLFLGVLVPFRLASCNIVFLEDVVSVGGAAAVSQTWAEQWTSAELSQVTA